MYNRTEPEQPPRPGRRASGTSTSNEKLGETSAYQLKISAKMKVDEPLINVTTSTWPSRECPALGAT